MVSPTNFFTSLIALSALGFVQGSPVENRLETRGDCYGYTDATACYNERSPSCGGRLQQLVVCYNKVLRECQNSCGGTVKPNN
ncbi:hypothetical protein FMEXI_6496 [Fusarium mexicanum]|uniref:ShKT domain-containing protein n=1 Tax=Fusarium mexicanum TaxID=751941 RepID=A0A8H5IXH8_9HYPO|nr:hypothetical protein FMEXI_6496 [Fusarium mexicanum]